MVQSHTLLSEQAKGGLSIKKRGLAPSKAHLGGFFVELMTN